MTAPMFSPARVLAIVLLAFLTAWWIGQVIATAKPTPGQVRQFEQACAAHSIPCGRIR